MPEEFADALRQRPLLEINTKGEVSGNVDVGFTVQGSQSYLVGNSEALGGRQGRGVSQKRGFIDIAIGGASFTLFERGCEP